MFVYLREVLLYFIKFYLEKKMALFLIYKVFCG